MASLAARIGYLEHRVIVTLTPGDDPQFVAILSWRRRPDVLRCEASYAQDSGFRVLIAADLGALVWPNGDSPGRLQRHHSGSLGAR
jgi:hypothetical protein